MATLVAGRILRESFALVFDNPLAYLQTVGVFVLAAAALSVGVDALMPGLTPDPGTLPADANPAELVDEALTALAVSFGMSAALFLLTSLGWAVGVPTTRALEAGSPPPTLPEAWSAVAPRIPNYLATMATAGLALIAILLAGTVLSFLIVPFLTAMALVLWLALRWALLPPVSLLETGTFAENFDRSASLTQGHKVTIFLVYLVLAALGVTGLAATAIGLTAAGPRAAWAFPAVATAIQLVLVPVGITATVRIYEEVSEPTSPDDLPDGL